MAAGNPQKKILTPEEARSVLQANVRNVVKKAAAGRSLSKSEIALLNQFIETEGPDQGSASPYQDWVGSYEELGKLLGLHRASLSRIKKDYADSPRPRANGDHDVKAWVKFLEAHPAIKCKSPASMEQPAGPSDPSAPQEKTKSELEKERLLEQVLDLRFDRLSKEGQYLKKEDVLTWQSEAMAHVTDVLRRKLENELPPLLVGLSAPQMMVKIRAVLVESCSVLKRGPTWRPGT